MINLLGEAEKFALFADGTRAVIIDKQLNMVDEVGHVADLSVLFPWAMLDNRLSTVHSTHVELAESAIIDLSIETIAASAGRLYTIPKAAQAEAKRALEWHKEHHRGGTPVGLNTARILARGGQIGLKKVRHIAKYFPRHEVDKKAKGYRPGEDGFPSNGRIAWALWGGDSAWRWAAQIVERENKKPIKADGSPYREAGSLDSFEIAKAYEGSDASPEFIARARVDGTGIDRLYMVDQYGEAFVWDGDGWNDLGFVDSDIYTYDRALDGDGDDTDKQHILIDVDSAIVLSAHLQQKPFASVSISDLDLDEANLVASAIDHVDWAMVDAALIAAGEEPLSGQNPSDGEYTPEERSANARRQVRDKTGKFSRVGGRVIVDGNSAASGSITRINPATQSVTVKMDDGTVQDVAANRTQSEGPAPSATVVDSKIQSPLDTSGILGQPRAPIDRPNATIPNGLPALRAEDLKQIIQDYPAWVAQQRGRQQPADSSVGKAIHEPGDTAPAHVKSEFIKGVESKTGKSLYTGKAEDHPLLQNFFKKPSNALWYNPITSAGAQQIGVDSEDKMEKPTTAKELAESSPGLGTPITPETSDVAPMYLAIVSPDDPAAVMDLVCIVPASTNSNLPNTFKRINGKWEPDPQILADLKSATPPPVVALTDEVLTDVLDQVDQVVTSSAYTYTYSEIDSTFSDMYFVDPNPLIAVGEGGLDRNRGKAEKLRRYWVYGRGAAKIRWGTPGDWKRCVRHLAKYMGPRAKGYCNLRHHEAIHMWPATHAKLLRGGRKKRNLLGVDEFIMEDPVYGFDFDAMAKDRPVTVVTKDDLDRHIEDIMSEHDKMYDSEWVPDGDIVSLIDELNREYDRSDEYAITAAFEGGIDRNRGKAEKLRHYWLYGRGALKIRWNTPGDWTRCYHQLFKYMGPRAKGYCALRHKEATGVWPGSKFNIGKKNKNLLSSGVYDYELADESQVIRQLHLRATMITAKQKAHGITADASMSTGGRFTIPLVVPEGVETGDGRVFDKDAITVRDLPLPLLWQIKTGDGHDGSVVVGRIDHMERIDNGIGNAYGVFDTGPYGREAERLVRNGFIRGVSADLDQFEASEEAEPENSDDDTISEIVDEIKKKAKKDKIGGSKIKIDKARVMAVTIVPKPAFQECKIVMNDADDTSHRQEDVNMEFVADGIYTDDVDDLDAEALVACGMVASSIPTVPPATWFDNPQLSGPTPLTVDDNGRVFGHIAAWHVNHIGMSYGTKPPRSRSKYSYFHTGVVRADDGNDYPVGQLTLAGGHASLEASAAEAARHYDDTGSAIADVHAGEDAYGIWVAGALRPAASPEQIRALRASAPSGDWRPINGALELVAVCQVNVPGFPIARARVASGQVYALVAAGAMALAKMKADPVKELASRLEKLEIATGVKEDPAALAAKAENAKAKFAELRNNKSIELAATAEVVVETPLTSPDENTVDAAELAVKAEELSLRFSSGKPYDTLGYISDKMREKLAGEGKALPDGSYPIRNVSELKDAIHAYGRSKPSKRSAVRKHIVKRAKDLGKPELIPENWNVASASDIQARVASALSISEFADVSEDERKALAKEGKALPDGSYPIRNVDDLKNAIKAYGRSKPGDRAKVRRHIIKRARQLKQGDMIPENWKNASTIDADIESLNARVASAQSKIGNIDTPKGKPTE